MELTGQDLPEPEVLVAAALCLAMNYAKTGCPLLCGMMVPQLARLRYHPGEAVPASLRETCGRLLAEWSRIGAGRAQALREAALARGECIPPLH